MVYLPKQAYPAALDAKPAAVGKLFSEQIWMLHFNNGLSGSFFAASSFTKFKY